jgi:glycosyltransferase involved in cell wall biosynthesis
LKKVIAIITPGGIGAGYEHQGFPAIVEIVKHLSNDYEIHVYSHSYIYKKEGSVKYFYTPKWISFSFVRWFYLISYLLSNHFTLRNYNLLFSFWGYPSGTIAVALSKILNKPSIVVLMGGETASLPEINYGLMRNSVTRSIVLWTCRKSTRIITLTNYQAENLFKYGIKRKVEVIPMGCDSEIFKPIKKQESSQLKIIHVANLTPVKDQKTLLDAFALICKDLDSRLKIIGPDFMNGELQKYATQIGIDSKVNFMGAMSFKKIAEQLQWADCFVLTSLSEGQNNSILEAMTCGLLPVSTKVGLMADLYEDYGIVVDIGDYKSISEKIIPLYKNREEWNRRLEKSTAWAREHDLNWTVNKIRLQILELVDLKKS